MLHSLPSVDKVVYCCNCNFGAMVFSIPTVAALFKQTCIMHRAGKVVVLLFFMTELTRQHIVGDGACFYKSNYCLLKLVPKHNKPSKEAINQLNIGNIELYL